MTVRILLLALALFLLPVFQPARAAAQSPLFAAEEPIRLTLQGPVKAVARGSRGTRPATLYVQSPRPERLGVLISPRGLTRLKRDVCQFAPIRLEFLAAPPPGSLFEGQRRLKLVTHCRPAESFQQHVLLEYAAYRLFNAITPASFKARLAVIDYADERGRPITTRLAFFIEDLGEAAARNGLVPARVGQAVHTRSLDPLQSSRVALFQYMIGNLDWSTRSGPPDERCCHNSRLIGPVGASSPLVPLPYDFDFSGLVDAPYSEPPDIIPVRTVRTRVFRGFCSHNALVAQTAGEYLAKRAEFDRILRGVPFLDERTHASASRYLDEFFADISDPQTIDRKLLRTCIG